MSNQLVPTDTPPVPVIAGVVPEVPTIVSDSEADAAAEALGMTFFKASKVHHLKRLGVFRGQQNVVHLGVGRLVACDDALKELLNVSVEIAQDSEEDAERRIGALMAGKGIVEVIQKGIQMEAEFHSEKLLVDNKPSRRRSFDQEDKPIIPIQAAAGSTVNINVDGKAESGKSIATP